MLLGKTLRSSTFKLALLAIGIFGASVVALFGYVYWSAASYVHSRSDHAITAEHAILRRAHDRAGRDELIATIEQRVANERFEGKIYLLVDPSFARVAGNLTIWPLAPEGPQGWTNFSAREWKPDAAKRPLLRAVSETLPDGYHLLVGKEIDDLDEFAGKIHAAVTWTIVLLFVLAGVAGFSVTRRTVFSRYLLRSNTGLCYIYIVNKSIQITISTIDMQYLKTYLVVDT